MLASASRHQDRLYRVRSSENLCFLNGEHRVNALRANYAAFTYECAFPHAFHFVDYWEVGHGLDGYCSTFEIVEEAGAGKFGLAVNVCSAAAADSHSARPSISEASIHLRLDIIQGVEYDHVVPVGDLVLLEVGFRIFLRSVPCYSYCGYVLAHLVSRHVPLVSIVLS